MEKRAFFQRLITAVVILGITTVVFLYTSGYRLTQEEKNVVDVKKTGMISAKSIPEGASIYLDDKIISATNDTISGINPGIHNLKITKKGYVMWEKDVEVFPELVTDITSVLISQTPRLEPLTNTGAFFSSMSPTLTKLAYFSKDPTKPGIWIIPLVQGGLSLFRTDPYVVIQNTSKIIYSNGKSIEWSPDEKKILVETTPNSYYIIDIQNNTSEATSSLELIRKKWSEDLSKKRNDFIEKLEIPDSIKAVAISTKSQWSPDDKKFLYTVTEGEQLEYHVYNMEKPIPIGEKVDNLVFTSKVSDPQPKISWYADSFHLILTQMDPKEKNKGSISLIRIDGSNKTEIYNNTLYSDNVYSSPIGDKLIILTSFKSGDQTNLYTIGIR